MWIKFNKMRAQRKKAKTAKKKAQLLKRKQYLADKAEIDALKRESRLYKARLNAKKEPWTFTKKLTTAIVLGWFAALIFCIVYWAFTQTWNSEIMGSVNVVAVPTILSYAVKSGFEYRTRFNVQAAGIHVTNDTSEEVVTETTEEIL